MSSSPLISIVTPVYNAERFIHETVDSVIQQSYQNWELWLINDQSTDQSASIIEQYAQEDNRIHVIHLEENSGAAVARNEGLKASKGNYIAFIDSDDVWEPNKLEEQLQFMQENNYVFTYTNLALMSEEGEVLKSEVDLPDQLDYTGLLKNTAIACSTVMINRQAVGEFYMPLVRKGQDTATWLMLMRERDIVAHAYPHVLNYYRQVEGSISSNRFGALKRTWYTYRHLEKLPLPKAIYYFISYVFNAVKRRL